MVRSEAKVGARKTRALPLAVLKRTAFVNRLHHFPKAPSRAPWLRRMMKPVREVS
jgi:hypothetical protein